MSRIIKQDQLGNYDIQPAFGPGARYTDTNVGALIDCNPAPVATAAKNDQAKPDLSLIPQVLLVEIAKAFMVGEKKYGRYNYTKGHNASQLVAAALRHLTAWNDGQEYDPTDGQHHLGSVGACIGMILRQQELGTLKDNRFKKDEK